MRYSVFLGVLSMGLFSCSGTSGSTKTAPPPPKTQITCARLQGSSLIIAANSIGSGSTASLGGIALKLTSSKKDEMTAALPEPLIPGTYLLVVSAGTPATTDSFSVTIGATGPAGPPGVPGTSSPPFPSGYSILGESPIPPKGFSYSG